MTLLQAFEPFGPDHVGALAVLAVACVAIIPTFRRWPVHGPRTFAIVVLGAMLIRGAAEIALGVFPIVEMLPLHLCDAAVFLAAHACWTRHPRSVELTWFWGSSGTLLAMVTPPISQGFPSVRFLAYFGIHGIVVVAAVGLVFGARAVPRAGGALRAWGWLNVYAVPVALINFVLGTNYLWLMESPGADTLLDKFGEWPWYVVVADGVALGLFGLLALPLLAIRRTDG